ncbi:MAG: radical SAM protein [Cyanobacteria bacterium]|nr:radical SAM protein [Cyanobacteria bacterium CG_2015-16_32_12]NCO77401.1 radical SAM protein [Cyanobacteria bacterium CG_2015-22_32_23]NCQ04350.1 radical SAM protein [Cyanobacteria bacterium CG_2015-09_32_10]NCQ42258.1 radical SAM protein [Cyanobacteria bacterium CG_2015-04_32_10]NCS83952.1 radical SAM protein [Cyanobacteria bacterium CG_2015-02_32_10]
MTVFTQEKLLFSPSQKNINPIPLIFAFPNEYSVGITSLGYQLVWANFSTRNDVEVSRLFTDIHENLPRNPELIGFSFSWELDYVNILNLLEFLNIPIYAKDRNENHPLIFGGGPVFTANPEPFADFFDIILLGDGENLLGSFIDSYQQVRQENRINKLTYLAKTEGIYIPSLYEINYQEKNGKIESIKPINKDTPNTVEKQTYRGNVLSASTVVTEKAAWENIYMVEVVRSCPEMCRFCLASYLTLPFRTASLEASLIPAIERGLKVTNRLGLLGASVTQHPEFDTLIDYLSQSQFDDIRVSIASVRTNTITEKLANFLKKRDTKSITIAIESGSAKIRQLINKKLENHEIIEAAINAQAGGLKAIKFYGMVGLPEEDLSDIDATIDMMAQVKKVAPKLKVTFGCSTFVPKSHTPFQWFGVDSNSKKRLQYLEKNLRKIGVDFRPESYSWSVIQALISRGDRRLSKLLVLTRNYGDTLGSYKRAFKELKGEIPSLDYYVHDNWQIGEVLPWQHLKTALTEETLIKHLQQNYYQK